MFVGFLLPPTQPRPTFPLCTARHGYPRKSPPLRLTLLRCFFLSTASCHNRAHHSPLQLTSGEATPFALAADAAMSRARRRSRTPAGRTERRSRREHHPAKPGRFAPMPRATRGGRGTVNSRDSFRVTAKRGVRGCRGCRGVGYPSHSMPRAGQATCRPLRAAAAMQGRKKEDEEQKRTAAGQGRNAKKTA